YDFTVTATSGPLDGVSASGSFTYDDVIAPPGGGPLLATGLLSDLSFAWNSIVYDATSANTGGLFFAADGSLSAFFFGSDCTAGVCATRGSNVWSILSV